MIKRTLEISQQPAYIALRNEQLVLKRDGEELASFPCEDLGVVIVDHPQASYSHAALARLVESAAVVVVCGRNHLPAGLLLPLSSHTQVVWRLHDQLAVSKPLRKQLWKQLVQAKILAQAQNLPPASAARLKLESLAKNVRSGDASNHESQAARIYWSAWLDDGIHMPPDPPFQRNPEHGGLNALLNYGYAILRAAVARCLVAAGLLPALGLHHSNRSNAFCLADDLLEPLRPLVDARVREIYWYGHEDLCQPAKSALLKLLAEEVLTGGETGPLLVSLHRYVASLVKCYQGVQRRLEIPLRCKSVGTAACGS